MDGTNDPPCPFSKELTLCLSAHKSEFSPPSMGWAAAAAAVSCVSPVGPLHTTAEAMALRASRHCRSKAKRRAGDATPCAAARAFRLRRGRPRPHACRAVKLQGGGAPIEQRCDDPGHVNLTQGGRR